MSTNTQTLLDLTTTWKKLGYTIQEAQGLAQVTQKFDLAGDLGNTTETANSLVSMLKGFKLDVGQNVEQQAMQIGDFINSASNNFAVSSKDITESLQRSSSALGAMGNNIQQSISMSTVMNEVDTPLIYGNIYISIEEENWETKLLNSNMLIRV